MFFFIVLAPGREGFDRRDTSSNEETNECSCISFQAKDTEPEDYILISGDACQMIHYVGIVRTSLAPNIARFPD